MNFEISEVLAIALIGFVGGVVGTILAPWAMWGVEKKRMQKESQMTLLKNTRDLLHEDISNSEFRETAVYSALRHYINDDTKKAVEGHLDKHGNEVTVVAMGKGRFSGVNPFRNQMLDELARLERIWKLI